MTKVHPADTLGGTARIEPSYYIASETSPSISSYQGQVGWWLDWALMPVTLRDVFVLITRGFPTL
jgi:hypothetical protein